ncbi:MAG: hypothetical protein J0I12_31035 [Candidatus Eremiobacteraeota bacterium]|nr:hypothetical protein [Candidatus Eremiobacteraeota bacterium]
MGSFLEPITLLSLTEGWLAGCLVATVWCAVRSKRQGYSAALFGSLGLLLGLGAIPLTWLATREDLSEAADGMGLNPQTRLPEKNRAFRQWARFYHGVRQLGVGIIFGLGGGFLANATQAFTHVLPQVFMETAEEYEAGHHTGAVVEMQIRIVWVLVMLVAPGLLFWIASRLLPRSLSADGLWLYYAQRSDPEHWRQLIPAGSEMARGLSEQEAICLRERFNRVVIEWPAWIIPAVLLVVFIVIAAISVLGVEAYNRLFG